MLAQARKDGGWRACSQQLAGHCCTCTETTAWNTKRSPSDRAPSIYCAPTSSLTARLGVENGITDSPKYERQPIQRYRVGNIHTGCRPRHSKPYWWMTFLVPPLPRSAVPIG